MHNLISSLVLLVLISVPSLAQQQPTVAFCKQAAFNALRPLPELSYQCPDGLNDYDEKILKWPERSAAIEHLESELASFAAPAWWQVDVADLTACEIHGSPGSLTSDETTKYKEGDFWLRLFGDHQYRLILVADPCYQTGYGGSNGFLLYRNAGKVFTTQVLNGYFSRVDNSVEMASANLNGQAVIEISTANNMPPTFTNYYFEIDPKNNRAIPKKIFKVDGRMTNKISSAIIFNEPDSALENTVIRRNRLAPAFRVYVDDDRGKMDDSGRKLRRVTYRWNGQFYSPASSGR